MQFKNLLKFLVFAAPLVAAKNCNEPDNIDSDDCKADILIVTSEDATVEQDEGFKSVVNTLSKFAVPANQLKVPINGIDDSVILRILYKGDKAQNVPRYKAIVFPNGRVSYNTGSTNEGDAIWESAIKPQQWDLFTSYSAGTKTRIVYLNEYPSNNTGTELAYPGNKALFKVAQKISISEDSTLLNELSSYDLNTQDTWHFQAKYRDPEMNRLDLFDSVEPLLYFDAKPEEGIADQSIGAVACSREGSEFAGFFTSFGSWSKTAAVLNIYWLTWALNTDFSKISSKQYSTEDAIRLASGAPKTVKLAMMTVAISTLFVIFANLI